MSLLGDDDDRDEANVYSLFVHTDCEELHKEANAWLEAEVQAPSVRPEDSVSQCDKSLNGSGLSTTSSALLLKAAAKRASLAVEAEMIKERQRLENEELKFRQQKEAHDLKIRFAMAETEEKVYYESSTKLDRQLKYSSSVDKPITEPRKDSEPKNNVEPPRSEATNGDISSLNPFAHEFQPNGQPTLSPKDSSAEPVLMKIISEGQQQQQRLLEALNLPKAELVTFDGDPIQFWVFMRSFENNVAHTSLDDNAKFTRLLHYCKGKARAVIQCCSVMEPKEGYKRALQLLKERFGNSHVIAESWLKKVTQGPSILGSDKQSLREFADNLKGCGETLKAMGHEGEISTQSALVAIVERLPVYLKNRWVRLVREIRKNKGRSPQIGDLISFVDDAAEEATDPVYGNLTRGDIKSHKGSDHKGRPVSFKRPTKANYSVSANEGQTLKCPMCEGNHLLFGCEVFKAAGPEERFKFVRNAKLCFNCLKPGHLSSSCTLNRRCTVEGCGRKHTKFLHLSKKSNNFKVEEPNVQVESQATDASCSAIGAGVCRTALPILPVKVRVPGKRGVVMTYVLLDNGSTSTFCTEQLAKQLGAKGPIEQLSLNTLDSRAKPTETSVVSLEVISIDSGSVLELNNVVTRARLNINDTNVAKQSEIDMWPHLEGIELPNINVDEIGILIGQDCPEALMPLEVKSGPKGSPFAVRTSDSSLEGQKGLSVHDKQALSVWEDTIKLKEGHYELSVPFKCQKPCFPENRCVAEHRLGLLKKLLN